MVERVITIARPHDAYLPYEYSTDYFATWQEAVSDAHEALSHHDNYELARVTLRDDVGKVLRERIVLQGDVLHAKGECLHCQGQNGAW